MKSFVISPKDDGVRLNRFIASTAPDLSGALMYKYLRLKRIKVNGARAEASSVLHTGDKVEMYINDEFFPNNDPSLLFLKAQKTLTVVYEDDNIAILNKPAGLIVHSDENEEHDTLINRFTRYLYDKGEYKPDAGSAFAPALCNRIDRGTFGLVIAAKNHSALAEMNDIIKNREAKKLYLAAVIGKCDLSGTKKAYLFKDEQSNRVTISDKPKPGYSEIISSFKALDYSANLTLMEIELITGKTHQIRAHLSHLGFPILGDGKYGIGTKNREYGVTRQALCSYLLTFRLSKSYPTLGYLNGKSFKCSDVWFKTYFE